MVKASYQDGRRGISSPLQHLQWEEGASQIISMHVLGIQKLAPSCPTSPSLSWSPALPDIVQLHETTMFPLLQSVLFSLLEMLPSSAQSTLHCFRIQASLPQGSFSWDCRQVRSPINACTMAVFGKHIHPVTAYLFTSFPWSQLPEGRGCVHSYSHLYPQHQVEGPAHVRHQKKSCWRDEWTHLFNLEQLNLSSSI